VKYCTLKIFQSAFVKVFGVLFFLANVICIVEAFLAWAETAVPLLLPSISFFAMTEYEPTCLHFFCAKN
jgi:hypothetical protein